MKSYLVVAISFAFLLLAFLVFFIASLKRRKHFLLDASGQPLTGIPIVICEMENTGYNQFTTAADGSFKFNFDLGWASIFIDDDHLGVREIKNHQETSVNSDGDAIFCIQSKQESLTFIVGPIKP